MIGLLHPVSLVLSAALGALTALRELRVPVAASGSCLALVAVVASLGANAIAADWRVISTIAVLFLICGLIAEIDRRSYLIPDALVLAVAALALGMPSFDLTAAVAGAVVTGSLFLLVRWLFASAGVNEALGLGDVKLAAAMGLFLGPAPALIAVAVAAGASAALLGANIAFARAPSATQGAPFGVGLAAALFVAAVHQVMTS